MFQPRAPAHLAWNLAQSRTSASTPRPATTAAMSDPIKPGNYIYKATKLLPHCMCENKMMKKNNFSLFLLMEKTFAQVFAPKQEYIKRVPLLLRASASEENKNARRNKDLQRSS